MQAAQKAKVVLLQTQDSLVRKQMQTLVPSFFQEALRMTDDVAYYSLERRSAQYHCHFHQSILLHEKRADPAPAAARSEQSSRYAGQSSS
jgi:hypothetical protein